MVSRKDWKQPLVDAAGNYKDRIMTRKDDRQDGGTYESTSSVFKSVLNEANAHKRQQRLRYANIDQINAVSELVRNTLRGVVPQGKFTLKRMRPHASALRFIANPRNSAKRRRHTMIHQLGAGNLVWKELHRCYECSQRLYK